MIDELIERVEKGEGADRELDFAVGLASGYWQASGGLEEPYDGGPVRFVTYTHPVYKTKWHGAIGACIPSLTTSLDAVLALIEENRSTIMDNSPADFLAGCIEEMMVRGWRPHEPSGPQICRAVLAAFLRAHKEQHDGR